MAYGWLLSNLIDTCSLHHYDKGDQREHYDHSWTLLDGRRQRRSLLLGALFSALMVDPPVDSSRVLLLDFMESGLRSDVVAKMGWNLLFSLEILDPSINEEEIIKFPINSPPKLCSRSCYMASDPFFLTLSHVSCSKFPESRSSRVFSNFPQLAFSS